MLNEAKTSRPRPRSRPATCRYFWIRTRATMPITHKWICVPHCAYNHVFVMNVAMIQPRNRYKQYYFALDSTFFQAKLTKKDRGQAEANLSRPRPRPRRKFWRRDRSAFSETKRWQSLWPNARWRNTSLDAKSRQNVDKSLFQRSTKRNSVRTSKLSFHEIFATIAYWYATKIASLRRC